jgi:hypothetical protein
MLSARIALSVAALLRGSLDVEDLSSHLDQHFSIALEDGAGAGQAAHIWSDRRTLASAASESIDLNGVLSDAFGASLALTKLKALIVVSDPANTTALTLGNVVNGIAGPFGPATGSAVVNAGGLLVIVAPDAAGYPIVAATADLLKVANAAGAAATYEVVVIGA